MVKSPAESSSWYRAAFLVLLLALVLYAVGFSTSSWSVETYDPLDEDESYRRTGLWQSCVKFVVEICEHGSVYKDEGWFIAVQVFETLGLVLLVIAWTIAVVLMIFVTSKFLTKLNINIAGLSGMFLVIGAAIYTIRKSTDDSSEFDRLGYSCWLTWIASFAIVIASIFLECDRRLSSARHIGMV